MQPVTDRERTTHASLRRAIGIMRAFSEHQPAMTVTELATQLDLHKSTVSRILSTLADEGLVYQHPESGRYSLGLGLVTMSAVAIGQSVVRSTALPYLDSLVADCGETAVLSVLRGSIVVTLAYAAPPNSIRFATWDGRQLPLPASVAGRILIADLSAKSREAQCDVAAVGGHSKLDDIAMAGVDAERDEVEIGMSSVTSPVHDHLGGVVGALSIVGPSSRLNDQAVTAATTAVQQAASNVSRQLGYQSVRPGAA